MIGIKSETWLNAREVRQAVNEAVIEPLDKAALLVKTAAQESMKMGGGTEKNSSAPGDPPNVQSGNLRNNIDWAREGDTNRVIGPTTTAWYGRVMEYGAVIKVTYKMRWFLGLAMDIWLKKSTKTIHIAPRPFMHPALDRSRGAILKLFKNLKLADTPTGRRLNRIGRK